MRPWHVHAENWWSSAIQFLPCDAMLARNNYAVVVCLSARLSVWPSVCLSHAGIMSKRLNLGSRKQRHTIAWGLSRCQRCQRNSNGVTRNRGAKCRWGRLQETSASGLSMTKPRDVTIARYSPLKLGDFESGDWGHSRSSKVPPLDTLCMISYSTSIYSNCGRISHRFWDTPTYWTKIVQFSHPLYSSPPLGEAVEV